MLTLGTVWGGKTILFHSTSRSLGFQLYNSIITGAFAYKTKYLIPGPPGSQTVIATKVKVFPNTSVSSKASPGSSVCLSWFPSDNIISSINQKLVIIKQRGKKCEVTLTDASNSLSKGHFKVHWFHFLSRSVETATRLLICCFSLKWFHNYCSISHFVSGELQRVERIKWKHLSNIHTIWKREKENEVQLRVIEIGFIDTRLDIVINYLKI